MAKLAKIYDMSTITYNMPVYTASEAKNSFGEVIDTALREPVMIQKYGRESIVMMSKSDYVNYLTKLDNQYWVDAAEKELKQSDVLSAKKSGEFLTEILNA